MPSVKLAFVMTAPVNCPIFHCNFWKWFQTNSHVLVCDDLTPPNTAHTYKVSVMTGDVNGSGTDANVFLTIYGDLGDTGERKLSKSETNKNKFERGSVRKLLMDSSRLVL